MTTRRPDGVATADAGFTLVELLVALAVLALVVGLALPFAGGGRHAGERAVGEAVAQLRQARAAALREARTVTVTGWNDRAVVFHADGSSSGGEIGVGGAVLRIDRLSGRVARVE